MAEAPSASEGTAGEARSLVAPVRFAMTRGLVRLFIERRFIPHDGSRPVIAAGTWPRQKPAEAKADEALPSDLAEALSEQQGGTP